MSSRYLLPCPECGKQIPVEGGRAGGTATCSCGKTVEVPRMGVLRTFPQEAVASVGSGSRLSSTNSSWGLRQGLMLAGLLLILAGGVPALYHTVTYPEPPFRSQEQIKDFADLQFDKMTVTESWGFWKTFIEPQGLTNQPTPYEEEYERKTADIRQWMMIFIAIAIVGAILLLTSFFVRGSQVR